MAENDEASGDLVKLNVRDADPDDAGEVMVGMPHGKAIAMRLHRSVGGNSHLSVPYDERLIGDPHTGVLHGGVITALLDTACGSAVMSMPGKMRSTATLDLRIDYMRPATKGLAVHAKAECYRMTRSVAFARAVAYHDDSDDPIASAAGAFVVERPKEPQE
ncbi:MAG: PaaI family thioesterase [Pseudomonadota bacterium]